MYIFTWLEHGRSIDPEVFRRVAQIDPAAWIPAFDQTRQLDGTAMPLPTS